MFYEGMEQAESDLNIIQAQHIFLLSTDAAEQNMGSCAACEMCLKKRINRSVHVTRVGQGILTRGQPWTVARRQLPDPVIQLMRDGPVGLSPSWRSSRKNY